MQNFDDIAELRSTSTNGLLLLPQGPPYILRNVFRSIDDLFQYGTQHTRSSLLLSRRKVEVKARDRRVLFFHLLAQLVHYQRTVIAAC